MQLKKIYENLDTSGILLREIVNAEHGVNKELKAKILTAIVEISDCLITICKNHDIHKCLHENDEYHFECGGYVGRPVIKGESK